MSAPIPEPIPKPAGSPLPAPDGGAAPTVKQTALLPVLAERYRWMAYPFWAFVCSRVAIFAFTGLGLIIDPRLHRGQGPIAQPWVRGLCFWDCAWYGAVGAEGYTDPMRAAFFPLFPLLSKAAAFVTRLEMPFAQTLVANLAGLGALLVIYKIFTELEGERVARAGLMLLVSWPFSFIHAAPYPESLMLLTSSGALLLAMRKRHILAGGVLGLGILARHLTVIAGLGLLVAQLRERGFHPKRFLWNPAFLGLLLPFVIASSYAVYCHYHYGDAFLWWTARSKYWGDLAWFGLPQFFKQDGWEPQIGAYVALSVIPSAGALMLLRKKDTWVLAAFALGLMFTVYVIGLAALGRYSASCWPAFLPLGVLLARRPGLETPVCVGFALLQGLFLYLFSHSYPIN